MSLTNGPIVTALESFRRHLAKCTAFREWSDVASESFTVFATRASDDAVYAAFTADPDASLAALQATMPADPLTSLGTLQGNRLTEFTTLFAASAINGVWYTSSPSLLAWIADQQDAQAATRIHIDALPRPANAAEHTLAELIALRPFAIIWMRETAGLEMRSDSTFTLAPVVSGNLVCRLEMNVPDSLANDPAALALHGAQTIGRILRTGDELSPGLWDLNFQPGLLPLVTTFVSGPARTNEDDRQAIGDAMAWEIEVQFGS